MIIRKLLNRTLMALVAASMMSTAVAGNIHAQMPPPPQGTGGLNYMDMSKMGKTTAADRKAAAERQALTRAAARASGVKAPSVVITPGMTPDYFGLYPNYANTQLPEVISGTLTPTLGTGVRKFVDGLPGVGPSGANNLGQYIVIGTPDQVTYPGSDYYEIGLVDYTEKMHSDIPTTTLRGYVQIATSQVPGNHAALTYLKTGAPILDRNGNPVFGVDKPSYLGPTIVAQKDRPVRVKFTNYLANGTDGNLFIPVDTTDMGAGTGPLGGNELYTENRATLHLHGGATPWISDGTPHQWTTPANEATSYPKGVSVSNVPDMPDPGPGSLTFFYTNQQSARLMFYHDHAYGMTRLNVYSGEAAGYLLQDPIEKQLMANGTIPTDTIPLIIQDKTFVPSPTQLQAEDPTWDPAKWGGQGNLWFPHVYMTNQNPWDISGASAMGRWDYGPWFWPPFVGQLVRGEIANPYAAQPAEPPMIPGTPTPSLVPEGYMDTPVINGTAYPTMSVEARPYRFRILNASNDRFWNLSLFKAVTNTQMWAADGSLLNAGAGEVPMVPAVGGAPGYPANWPSDGRDGGVPDPTAIGPNMVQIGTEGGFLPAPAVITSTPVGYNYNRRDIVVLNVSNHALWLGPAERADVIVDFSQYAGQTLILYNDSPAPVPAFDPRNDYYTGDPDQTSTGGAPTTLPGYGPNTRTIMQIKVQATTPITLDVAALKTAWASNGAHNGVFEQAQDPILIPDSRYNSAYNTTFISDTYARLQYTQTSFTPLGATSPITMYMEPKAIQELFELDYGRMNATLGTELPNTTGVNQTTIPLGYTDPTTEDLTDSITPAGVTTGDGTQIWKVVHNGVDTHAIHFHLFNVQVLNRVGWDGAVRPPDDNELGWKETVKMHPLEIAFVVMRPVAPKLPFGVPESVRALNPTMPLGATWASINPNTGNPNTVINAIVNYGWEYVWHCHLLGHEENDMMRPMVFRVKTTLPSAPSPLTGTVTTSAAFTSTVVLTWTDTTPATLGNPANEIGFRIYRATGPGGAFGLIGTQLANMTNYTDTTVQPETTYRYRVSAYNVSGQATSNIISLQMPSGPVPAAPDNLTAVQRNNAVMLNFRNNSRIQTSFVIQRMVGAGAWTTLTTIASSVGPGTTIVYTDNGVSIPNTYSYRAQAVSGVYSSSWSNIATVAMFPLAPSNLRVPRTGTGNITIAWTNNQTLPPTNGIQVYYSANGSSNWQLLVALPGTATSYTNWGVASGTTRFYRVRDFVVSGGVTYYSNWSNTISGRAQ